MHLRTKFDNLTAKYSACTQQTAFFYLVMLTCQSLTLQASVELGETVRIAVGRFTSEVSATGDRIVATDLTGQQHLKKDNIKVTRRRGHIVLNGINTKMPLIQLKADGPITIGKYSYAHTIEVSVQSVKGRDEILVVNQVELEDYVRGVIGSEMSPSWPIEALKSQAVISRTYALWNKYNRYDQPYHMESNVLDQVYRGLKRQSDVVKQAVKETYGEIMVYMYRPAQTYFSATCGDHTEDVGEIWRESLPYLPGVECGYCKHAPRHRWDVTLTEKEVRKAANVSGRIKSIEIISRTKAGSANKIKVRTAKQSRTIKGTALRAATGYTKMYSTRIDKIKKTKGGWRITGKGFGHGIGLCQWGAHGMAEEGKSYKDILEHYYPAAHLQPVY